MIKENRYGFLAKIIVCLLLVLIIITFIYGYSHFNSKGRTHGLTGAENKEKEIKTFTEKFKVDELCQKDVSCNKKFDVQFNEEKKVNINYGRTILEGELNGNKIYIDDTPINVPDGSVIDGFGILHSKYFVISYVIGDSRTFYYLDEFLRDVKIVPNVNEETEIDSLNYKYFTYSSDGNHTRIDYEMKIKENGTFISNIVK